jgi:hypothetical protein
MVVIVGIGVAIVASAAPGRIRLMATAIAQTKKARWLPCTADHLPMAG